MMYSSECLMTSVTSPAPFATAVTLTQEPFLPEQERTMTRFSAFWVSFWKLALVTLALFALPISSGAGVIVSVTDLAVPVNRAAFFLGGEFSNVVAASWTQNESFSGVTIDASIVTSDSSFRNGTAYRDALLFDVVSNVPEPQNAGVVLILLVALLLGVSQGAQFSRRYS